jgi:hypothetical protein
MFMTHHRLKSSPSIVAALMIIDGQSSASSTSEGALLQAMLLTWQEAAQKQLHGVTSLYRSAWPTHWSRALMNSLCG